MEIATKENSYTYLLTTTKESVKAQVQGSEFNYT